MAFDRKYSDMQTIPRPPCETCPNEARCKALRMACYEYAGYTGDRFGLGKEYKQNPLIPTTAIYQHIYNETNQ